MAYAGVRLLAVLLGFAACAALAQQIETGREDVDPTRPEGWALSYASAITIFGGFGAPQTQETGTWWVGGEAGHIPTVSRDDTRVGFDGGKFEDLNKAPVFGRLRAWYALPGGFTLEGAWTPPLTVSGITADALVAAALGRPIVTGDRFSLGARAFAQIGSVKGDITCSNENVAAGPQDQINNPFNCRAPSNDEVDLDQYGIELTGEWRFRQHWSVYAGAAATRIKPEIQINAEVFEDTLDRSVVATETTLETWTLGIIYRTDGWEALLGAAYTPLDVRRPPERELQNDELLSARLMVRIPL